MIRWRSRSRRASTRAPAATLLLIALLLIGACGPIPAAPTPTPTDPALVEPAASPEPTEALPTRNFPETGFALSGPFLEFWEQTGGAEQLGPPLSDALWLDGRTVQFFAEARLEAAPGAPVEQVALAPAALNQLPSDLFELAAAPQRVTLSAPAFARPLDLVNVTLRTPGYDGPAELHLYDSRARRTGVWMAELRAGAATLAIEARGALGAQLALVVIDGAIAGATSKLFVLTAETTIHTGQPRFDELYPYVYSFMRQDVLDYTLDGVRVRGYRSPDNPLLWLRDHTYQARGFRYFERDVTSLIDAFRRAQRHDGSFPDFLARPEIFVEAGRKEVEADVEYLFVQAVYEAWQATGDDAWLRGNLEAMRRGIRYTMSDPLRWEARLGLVKRPYTIDTWDFEYGPTTIDPGTGRPAPRHWIDERTIWGIFHGDNTGLAHALELLARIEERVGDPAAAARWRADARGVIERLNELSWNGSFYTHFVPLEPFDVPGVDEARQLSLSNTYALNRGVLEPEQGRAIVDEYYRRSLERGTTFAEWWSIDPPFPPGSFGMGGGKGEQPGEYVNGGIMPLVGGELARGAFRYGAERYAFEILARYHFLIDSTGESYLWYYPEGNPGKSGPHTLPTDGWGASAMLGALIEGAAGVEDTGALYRQARLSPRWAYTGDVREALVVARYAASDAYVAYRWRLADRMLALDLTGSGDRAQLRLLLPEQQEAVTAVTFNGAPHPYTIEQVFGSRYVVLDVDLPAGRVEVYW